MSLLKKVLYYVTILVEGVGVDVPGGGDGDGQQVAGGNGQQDGVCRGPHLGSEESRMNQIQFFREQALSQQPETRSSTKSNQPSDGNRWFFKFSN